MHGGLLVMINNKIILNTYTGWRGGRDFGKKRRFGGEKDSGKERERGRDWEGEREERERERERVRGVRERLGGRARGERECEGRREKERERARDSYRNRLWSNLLTYWPFSWTTESPTCCASLPPPCITPFSTSIASYKSLESAWTKQHLRHK